MVFFAANFKNKQVKLKIGHFEENMNASMGIFGGPKNGRRLSKLYFRH